MPQRVPCTRSSFDNVEPGARVITDAWSGYRGLERLGYQHERRNQSAAAARGEDPGRLLPGCTGSRHWPNDGCWAHTRVQLNVNTSPTTSTTNSPSGSTAATHAPEECCSIDSCSKPSIPTLIP